MVLGMIQLHAVILGMGLLLLLLLLLWVGDVVLLLLLPHSGILHGDLHACTSHLSTGLTDCWLLAGPPGTGQSHLHITPGSV